MERHFDFVAIGGGSAGFNAARMAKQFSNSVAVIDGARELGGLCILRGCMPSKTLIYTAEIFHHAKHAEKFGINVAAATADHPDEIDRQRVSRQASRAVRDYFSSLTGDPNVVGGGDPPADQADPK